VSLVEFEEKDDGVTITAKSKVVADLGMGRPLGGRFDAQGTLYIADAHLGLTRLKNPGSGSSKVELVASRVFDQEQWTPILYANDVAVGPNTGMVYFTDCKYSIYWQQQVSMT
jgi:sugar lactone lactonase YvrE